MSARIHLLIPCENILQCWINQHQSRHVCQVYLRVQPDAEPAQRMSDQHVGRLDSQSAEKSTQILGRVCTSARLRTRITESEASPVIRAGACNRCNPRLHESPYTGTVPRPESKITRGEPCPCRLQEALQLVDVRVLDHLIVAGDEILSFAERGLI